MLYLLNSRLFLVSFLLAQASPLPSFAMKDSEASPPRGSVQTRKAIVDNIFIDAAKFYHGHGVVVDLGRARRGFKAAACEGHMHAQNNYAYMCARGIGGDRDLEEAYRNWKLAADQGHSQAANNYGIYLLRSDQPGVLKYLRIAATSQDLVAKKNYANWVIIKKGHEELTTACQLLKSLELTGKMDAEAQTLYVL